MSPEVVVFIVISVYMLGLMIAVVITDHEGMTREAAFIWPVLLLMVCVGFVLAAINWLIYGRRA